MYLITGGAGFIGSHIAARLAALGERVRVLDNASGGAPETIAAANVETVAGDVANPAVVRRAMTGVNVVFHLAAIHSAALSLENPGRVNHTNIDGTLEVLAAARDAGVRRVVYASSAAVYGSAGRTPLSEKALPAPASPYAVSKLAGEYYCRIFAERYGLETVSLRYFNVFGPGQEPDAQCAAVIPCFIRAALRGEPLELHGDGLQSRDFTYVDNVVDATLLAAESHEAVGEVFNVGQGGAVTLIDLLDRLGRVLGAALAWSHVEARPGDVKYCIADISKAARLLGYRPRVSFEEGLDRTIARFRQEADRQSPPDDAERQMLRKLRVNPFRRAV